MARKSTTSTTTRFVPNPNLERELMRATFLEAPLKATADRVAAGARDIAPVDEGDYMRGITTYSGADGKSVLARVVGTDWKSGLIELATIGGVIYAPLRKAAERLGLRLSGRG